MDKRDKEGTETWCSYFIQGEPNKLAKLKNLKHAKIMLKYLFWVLGLPVGVGPLFVVLGQVTYPQEGSQHQWLSSYQNKVVILHKGGYTNEKRLFQVKELPGSGDNNKRLLLE